MRGEEFYSVNDIYASVQGEGAQTGVAMIILRLQGCSVGCPWCDTKQTWIFDPKNERRTIIDALGENPLYSRQTADAIAYYIYKNIPGPKWVLITGGEPADHVLTPLVLALHSIGYKVALETSGTAGGHLNAAIDWICVSPKFNMPGKRIVQHDYVEIAHEIKHVIGRLQDIKNLEAFLKDCELRPDVQICLQPVSQNERATQLCLDTVIRKGWRMSLQTHKYMRIR